MPIQTTRAFFTVPSTCTHPYFHPSSVAAVLSTLLVCQGATSCWVVAMWN